MNVRNLFVVRKHKALLYLTFFCVCRQMILQGQTDSGDIGALNRQRAGVSFEYGKSWDSILKAARVSKKYIFLDCFTSWCKPCKEMDFYVYSNTEVGEVLNKSFVSVKV